MAQVVITTITDDITGGDASETIEYTFAGQHYEIDLNEKNAAAMRKALAKWVEASRTVRTSSKRLTAVGGKASRSTAKAKEREYDPAAVREWAAASGIEVSARGRIPASVVEQYMSA